MGLFRRSKSPSHPSTSSSSSNYYPTVPSNDQLGSHPISPPPNNNINNNNVIPHNPNYSNPNFILASSSPGINRSQSQRQSYPYRDRPSINVAPPEDSPSHRSKKNLSGLLERRGSLKHKPTPTSPRSSLLTTEEHPHPAQGQHMQQPQAQGNTPNPAYPYKPRSTSLAYQQQHPQHSSRSPHQTLTDENSQFSQQQPVSPTPPLLQRSNTDPNLLDHEQQRPPADLGTESLRSPPNQSQRQQASSDAPEQSLSARPPSRQTYEPSSPLRAQTYPAAMQQTTAQAQLQQPQGQSQQPSNDWPSGAPSDHNRRGSATQPQPMPPEAGRNTPVSHRGRDAREGRDEPGEIDVRALIQKHEELQAKYSKVKRYYFEKDAQVQHLQNTVAHQRMAVSRTVLDDNEYANRFQRLDGAIKDLAFSVRKVWRGIPPWLHGQVTEDAVSAGTKEMMAVGRAVISRWLVEEVFQRYFHPALEPNLSLQLKNIDMNLRRQSGRAQSEEDRENCVARLSNWRRTTFDGLNDELVGPAAEDHRTELIQHLVGELAHFLGAQLHEAALQQLQLEASVRMIIENTINISEKIPLEARDVCVEYFPPGTSFVETCMKVEAGLPALNAQPRSPVDQETEEQPTGGGEGDTSSGSNSAGAGNGDGTSQQKPPPKKSSSMFGALMGRKPVTNESGRAPAASDEKGEGHEGSNAPRIRFAAFPAVEVRGRGPLNVLMKAPVWME